MFTILGGGIGFLFIFNTEKPISRNILIEAQQYYYTPSKFEVNKGDTLHINLVSLDVTHGFYLEGYDVDARIKPNLKKFQIRKPSEGENWIDTNDLVIIVNKTGKFHYRCSNTCGNMHPFMQGEMIVKPNLTFTIGIGVTIGLTIGLILMFYMKIKNSKKTNSN